MTELKEILFKRLEHTEGLRAFESSGKVFLAHHVPKKIDYYQVVNLQDLLNLSFPVKRGRTGVSKEMMKHLQFLN